jgi:hypothetical protein
MLNRKGRRAPLLALAFTLVAAAGAAAQDSDPPRQAAPSRAEANYEVHIHLLATADAAAAGGARVPQSLDGVVRQLRSALPPSDYRLAAAFIYRVRDGGSFDVKTPSGGAFASAQTPGQSPPTTFQISLGNVKMIDPASAQPSVGVQQFRLGMRMPVQTAAVRSGVAEGSHPVMQYEDVGVNSQFSVREGEPTLVGTLDSTRPGQLFVIVVTIRRAGR